MSKSQELSSTEPQTLSGVGRFSGFKEIVAMIQERLLRVEHGRQGKSRAEAAQAGELPFHAGIKSHFFQECKMEMTADEQFEAWEQAKEDKADNSWMQRLTN